MFQLDFLHKYHVLYSLLILMKSNQYSKIQNKLLGICIKLTNVNIINKPIIDKFPMNFRIFNDNDHFCLK